MRTTRLRKMVAAATGWAALSFPTAGMAQPTSHANQDPAAAGIAQSDAKTVKGHMVKINRLIGTAQTPGVNGHFTDCVTFKGVFETSSGTMLHFTEAHDYLVPG